MCVGVCDICVSSLPCLAFGRVIKRIQFEVNICICC